MKDDDEMRGWHTPAALAALRSAPPLFHYKVSGLIDKQIRCGWSRPGGAARRYSEWVKLPDGTDVTVVKEAMRDGGMMKVVLGWGVEATLAACNLRLLRDRLPETVVTAAEGRRIGEIIELRGMLASVSDATVRGVFEDKGHHVITLDLPSVQIRRRDVSAEPMESAHAKAA